MTTLALFPPSNPEQQNQIVPHCTCIKREKRELHAMRIELEGVRTAVCVRPADEPDRPICKLPDTSDSWIDASAGDTVLLWDAVKRLWIERIIARITLHRVFPVKYCDLVVPSAGEWLDGVNGIHKSAFGTLSHRLPCDRRGFVPTADTEAFDLEFDHIEDTHTVYGRLTGYGYWWKEYRWPQIVEEVLRLTESADGEIASNTPAVHNRRW